MIPPTLLAVDPGKSDAGVAYFIDGKLVACALLRPDPGNPYTVAQHVALWLPAPAVDTLVVEGQQVYGGPRKEDPNDLIPLAEVVGGVKARIKHKRCVHPLPRVWTASVPKEVRHRRLLGLLVSLDPAALAIIDAIKCPKDKVHNVLDAIALGVWAIRRPPPEGLVQ